LLFLPIYLIRRRSSGTVPDFTTFAQETEPAIELCIPEKKTDKLDETAAILYNIREMTWPGGLCGGRNDPDACG